MADGYGRADGQGRGYARSLITGPGVTNCATPLAQAYADSVPMLLVSSANRSESLGKGWGCLHELSDQSAVTAPLTAFSAMGPARRRTSRSSLPRPSPCFTPAGGRDRCTSPFRSDLLGASRRGRAGRHARAAAAAG